jgi:hypothetical protein
MDRPFTVSMVEVQIIACPHCGQEALAGSQRLRLDGRLGCVHCEHAFDLRAAKVRTIALHSEAGTVAWGGRTRERRRQGRVERDEPCTDLSQATPGSVLSLSPNAKRVSVSANFGLVAESLDQQGVDASLVTTSVSPLKE